MTPRTLLSFGLSALVLGGTTVGCAGGGGIASAGTRAPATPKQVARAVDARSPAAIGLAEAAVAAEPRRADLRALLGRAYLQAGRFQSARTALADAVRLQPGNGRVALNLALAEIATGDWNAARITLETNAAAIPPADLGLAVALAGDPAGGVRLLMQAARTPGADAKVRQNLGLALALAGQWPMARAVAATDLSPAEVDGRLREWAAFAQPAAASDQVATLLGVAVRADEGQPVTLALNAPVAVVPATVEPAAFVPPAAAPAGAVAAAPALAPVLSAAAIRFGPRQEVVQALPVPLLRAGGPAKRPLAPRVAALPKRGSGDWVVQLGAFDNAGVARDAWSRISRRLAGVLGDQPQGAAFRTGGDDFYRLSVGGYDRVGADGICRQVRARGASCFVRRTAGDRLAQWPGRGVELASR